jgi:hypothetical protein
MGCFVTFSPEEMHAPKKFAKKLQKTDPSDTEKRPLCGVVFKDAPVTLKKVPGAKGLRVCDNLPVSSRNEPCRAFYKRL